jgi:phosphatidyl-N-methylethanolamine N-methyltransferase
LAATRVGKFARHESKQRRTVSLWIFLAAALLLSFERICYLWIWRAPDRFRARCVGSAMSWISAEPVDVLQFLFWGFKILQCAVFVGWCLLHGDGSLWPAGDNPFSLGLGSAMIAAGQILNFSVFYRLGKVGVFYGNKLGYRIPWSRKFPFSCLKHPQYVGALLSIWGFFLVMRFPFDDWYLLPALETIYYSLGAYLER